MYLLPKSLTAKYFLKPCLVMFFLSLFISSIIMKVNSADTSGVSVSIDVVGSNVESGHIVILNSGFYMLSFGEYDEGIFGVVSDNPTLAILDTNLEDYRYITTTGQVAVKVVGINGAIEEGDYITTSRMPGIGQRADVSGPVLGIALESYESDDPNEVGEILVYVNINSVLLSEDLTTNLVGLLRSGFKVPFLTPLTSLRYLLAALVVIISFFIGFTSFGRISSNSIEALGRNPLASKIIKSAIFLNFLLTLTIVAVGLVISYLILSL
jgi:F0F1-type ATP synthase membrane subunit c/vacuolar-type H+-ATPase subunit K